jgi:hypothetical protein
VLAVAGVLVPVVLKVSPHRVRRATNAACRTEAPAGSAVPPA